jgi:lipopolysaccharide export system ATP-binding protein
MKIFEAKNLTVLNKANNIIFKNFSFEISNHSIWMATGPNGIGKSSLWEALIGIRKFESGSIFLNNTNITNVIACERVRLGMKYISQANALFDDLSVLDNLIIVADSLLPKNERKQAIEQALEAFDLTKLIKQKANNLSGGQRRRVELSKIMIGRAYLVLLDEPFAAIDEEYTYKIAHIFKTLSKQGISFLINDHNTQMVRTIANYCIHLSLSQSNLQVEKIQN